MLAKRPQIHIVSQEVTLVTGELVRAFFAVIESDGYREIKFIGTRPVEAPASAEAQTEVLLLDAPKATVFGDLFIPSYFQAVSPFYTLDFLTSQLARAPSVR